MFSTLQYLEQLEDDLYREYEDDSEGSEADSELEFHLYSQLHYSSNAGEVNELEDKKKEIDEISTEGNHNITDSDKLGQLSENRSTAKKKEKVQGDKEKKRTKQAKNDKAKGQRASSTVFEEVIVIDSSPDVITLSEDDSSDESGGVCALKGQRLPKRCTSTPAQVKKGVFDTAVPVNISSSESESESESQSVLDSSSCSDSDHVENWMILSHGQQDGDQSISLNLDGVVESETDGEELDGKWLISDKDRTAQIFNKSQGVRPFVQRLTSRYYTDKNVHCKNCNRTGHLSKNCPEPKKVSPCILCSTPGHMPLECPYKYCHNCGLPGHRYSSCSERAYWHKQCHRCKMTGHFHDGCPEIWRQYHITIKLGPPVIDKRNGRGQTRAYCYNCAKKGHFGHECQKQRMFNGSYPSTPFINHYDTTNDIKGRQRRIEQKVKDLKNNGLLPHVPYVRHVPQSLSTPEPPRKKQKTSFEKNNHHHKRTSHQSFKTDLPASSHIFFSDASDSDSICKTSKHQKYKRISQEKTWKPKRPVPQSRDSVPKVVLDEADDFPRGGGQGEEMERRKKSKKMKKNGQSLCWTNTSKQAKDKSGNPSKKKKNKKASKKTSDKMYPTDENLFIIKQRKHKRKH
ncbi:zinc finger CCHC domain-containing protein 7 [Periophthalmus magnuspinnatus]|uniref:zinc finger CCHC domain-containing protein 7 n=1 Tax=Periophthalmus magnuspinnatus TaxID=409849 RepID=UPI00145AF2BB|nr:zinc finger CCHC domain-containing protein 7 [Periophthalmus magnuspinnatus]